MTMNWFPFGGRTDQPPAVEPEPDPGLLEKCIERLDPKIRFLAVIENGSYQGRVF